MGKKRKSNQAHFDKAIQGIVEWSQKDAWQEHHADILHWHVAPAYEEAGIDPQALEEMIGPDGSSMLWGVVFEHFLTGFYGPEEINPIDDYLKRRGWQESVQGKQYLQGLRDSVLSLYEVVDVDPGRFVILRDLILGGDPIKVTERSGSQYMVKWDRFACRMVHVLGKPLLTGGVLPLPPDVAVKVKDALEDAIHELEKIAKREVKKTPGLEMPRRAALAVEVLLESPVVFTGFWMTDLLQKQMNPKPPMVNFDGEELVFMEIRYPMTGDHGDEIRERLDVIKGFYRNEKDESAWNWLRDPKGLPRAGGSKPEGKIAYDANLESGKQVMGMVELREGAVVLTVNAKGRAETGRALLEKSLDGLVGTPLTGIQTLEQAMDANNQRKEQGDGPPPPSDLSPQEEAQILNGFLDQHFRKILKERIPALDNKTPRQALRSKVGRRKVVEWLKMLENNEMRRARESGLEPYDATWMWEELGIADLRS